MSLSLIAFIFASLFVAALPVHSATAGDAGLQRSEQDQIDAYIESRMRTSRIPGLALGVVRGDQVVYLKGYGIAGPGRRPVTPQTPFIIGSLSKSFTALAVMQLVEAGQIDLDAPVTRYLPWFRTADAAASARITVRHLLNQNSGLPVYEGRRGLVGDDQGDAALETGVRQLSSVVLSHPAGQAFEYANENYSTLGLIVQTVSASAYEDVIRAKIFAPLQMRHSAAALSDRAAHDIASGHRYWFSWPIAFDGPYPRGMTPSGLLISSAEDMSHYLIAHLNGGAYNGKQILSPDGLATLHAPAALMRASFSYAMGWAVRSQAGSLRIEHSGDVSNFHSDMLLLPDQKTGIVVLMNVAGFTNAGAVNIPIEGVAAIVQGHGLSPAIDPPRDWLTPALLLVPLLIAAVWVAGSFVFIRRWQRRGELPVRGWPVVLRHGLALAVDLCLGGAAWIVIPIQFQAPIATIRLFAPDVFVIIVLLSALGLGCALGRSVLVLRLYRASSSAIVC